MATVLDLTEFGWALKTLYDDARIMSAINAENPAFARIPKSYDFKQKQFSFAIKYGAPSRSATFTKAQTNFHPSQGIECIVTRKRDYAVGRIDTETMLASEGDPDELRNATESEADACMQALSNSAGHAIFGCGDGCIGTIGNTDLDTTTLTLHAPAAGGTSPNIIHFDHGQKLVFAADNTSALRDSGKTLTVVSVNEAASTCVLSAKLNTVSSLAHGDSIFTEGDYVSSSDRLKFNGFDAWNPATAPASAESWLGNADRSVNAVKLAGHRYTSTTDAGLTTLEAIQLVASKIKRSGFSADTCYMGTDRFRRLSSELEGKVTYDKQVVPLTNAEGEIVAEVGFDSVVVHTGGARVQCFADRNCSEDTIYVQRLDTWELKAMGTIPRWVVQSATVSDADQIEFRLAYWGQAICRMPAANGRYDWL